METERRRKAVGQHSVCAQAVSDLSAKGGVSGIE